MRRTFDDYKKKKFIPCIVSLYIYICICALVIYFTVTSVVKNAQYFSVIVYLVLSAIMMISVWFYSIYDIIILIVCFFRKKTAFKFYDNILKNNKIIDSKAKVAVMYYVCDDFLINAFLTTQKLTYKNYKVFVCDDSRKQNNIDLINNLQKRYKFEIVRRNGVGPKNKSGNVNYFLSQYKEQFDYYLPMDSDTYLTKDCIQKFLAYFNQFKNTGVIQGSFVNVNIDNMFRANLNSCTSLSRKYWSTMKIMNNEYGYCSMYGHGCLISKEAYGANGWRISEINCEDMSFTIDTSYNGYRVILAPNIILGEEIPPNYFAFKSRQMRWLKSTEELYLKFTPKLLKSKMLWFEKIHFLSPSQVFIMPIYSFISFVIFYIAVSFLPTDYEYHLFPWELYILSIIFFIFSLVSQSIYCAISNQSFLKGLSSSLISMFIYGSFFVPSFIAAIKTLFNRKHKYNVSIKNNQKITFWEVIRNEKWNLLATGILLAGAIGIIVWKHTWFLILNPFLIILFISFICIPIVATISNKKCKVINDYKKLK